MGHKICFYGEIGLIIPVTLSYLEHWDFIMILRYLVYNCTKTLPSEKVNGLFMVTIFDSICDHKTDSANVNFKYNYQYCHTNGFSSHFHLP